MYDLHEGRVVCAFHDETKSTDCITKDRCVIFLRVKWSVQFSWFCLDVGLVWGFQLCYKPLAIVL